MANSVYKINKGINRPVEFRGLRAQYIWYLATGLVVLLILFAILYITGINTYILLIFTLAAGASLFIVIYRMNHKYGQYGLMKALAKRKVPKVVIIRSRKIFWDLCRSKD